MFCAKIWRPAYVMIPVEDKSSSGPEELKTYPDTKEPATLFL